MAQVKIAISISADLLDVVDGIAGKMEIPRSRVVSLAIEDFVERKDHDELLEKINSSFSDKQALLEKRKRRKQMHRKIVKGTW